MSSKVILVISNGFLISTWKYWVWMSKYYSYTLNEYRLKRVLIILLSKTVCGHITLFQLENYRPVYWRSGKELLQHTFTSQQFWKQTKNDLKWCNFKMHVTGYFSIIKHLLWRASKEPFSFLFWFLLLCYYSFFCVWFSCEDVDVKLK